MNITSAILHIKEWYDGESFSIKDIVTEPVTDTSQVFEQSDYFAAVAGWQGGDESGFGPSHHGEVYFKITDYEWIKTEFYS